MNRRSLLKTLAALPLMGLAPKPQRQTRIAFVRAEVVSTNPLSKERWGCDREDWADYVKRHPPTLNGISRAICSLPSQTT